MRSKEKITIKHIGKYAKILEIINLTQNGLEIHLLFLKATGFIPISLLSSKLI